MNDELWRITLECAADGIKIGKIKTTNIPRRNWGRRHGVPPSVREGRPVAVPDQANDAPARGKSRRGVDEIIANQPVCAGDPSKGSDHLSVDGWKLRLESQATSK